MRTFRLLLMASSALLLLPAVTRAAPGKAGRPAPVKPVSRAQAIAQADGILDRMVDNLWLATDRYWHEGDYNRIVALIRVVVEADPSFTEAWESATWLLWSMGDNEAADAFVTYGLARSPNKGELNYSVGWHLFNTKRYGEALPYLEAAVRYPEATSQAWKTLAHDYERLERVDDAVRAWTTVVEKYPADVAGPPNLKRIKEKQAQTSGSKL